MTQLFGKNYQEAGKSSSPLLLRSNGEIKIQWGNKYIDLIKNGKLNSSAKEYIFTVSNKDDILDNGIYLVTHDNSIWFSQNGTIQQISNSDSSYVSFETEQQPTADQKLQALTNIGFYYNTLESAKEAGNGIIFNKQDNKLYIVNEGATTEYSTSNNQSINIPANVLDSTYNQNLTNLAWIKSIYNKLFPIGTIIMYNNNLTIPEGWSICDGTNGTPNLIDAFIKGGYNLNTYNVTTTESSSTSDEDTSNTEELTENTSNESFTKIYSVVFIMKCRDLD